MASNSDNTYNVRKVVTFTGEDDNEWRSWSAKTRAIASLKEWEEALQKDLSTSKDEVKIKQDKNTRMYLTLACTQNAFEYIAGHTSAHAMWSSLKERFEPEEIDDYLDLSQAFYKCRLSDEDQNPEKWFQQMDHITNRMKNIDPKYKKDEMEIKSFTLSSLPEGYSEVVISAIKTIGTSTVKSIRKEIMKFYRRKFKRNEDLDKIDDVALSAEKKEKRNRKTDDKSVNFNQRKSEKCKCCGRTGHNKRD